MSLSLDFVIYVSSKPWDVYFSTIFRFEIKTSLLQEHIRDVYDVYGDSLKSVIRNNRCYVKHTVHSLTIIFLFVPSHEEYIY